MTSGEEVPNDILTKIQAVVGVVALITCSTHTTPSFPPVGDKSVDMETLVDDFVIKSCDPLVRSCDLTFQAKKQLHIHFHLQ